MFHDGVGYVFPDEASLVVRAAEQRGSWRQINRVYPKKEIVEQVFSLWIEHGSRPTNASYEYVVLPGVTVEQLPGRATHLPVHVVQNSPTVQAVQDTDAQALAAAFYEADTVKSPDGVRLSVDKPCLVLLRKTNSKTILALSNPENKPLQVTVEINRKLVGPRSVWQPAVGTTRIRCALPEGMNAGQSLVLSLSS